MAQNVNLATNDFGNTWILVDKGLLILIIGYKNVLKSTGHTTFFISEYTEESKTMDTVEINSSVYNTVHFITNII